MVDKQETRLRLIEAIYARPQGLQVGLTADAVVAIAKRLEEYIYDSETVDNLSNDKPTEKKRGRPAKTAMS